MGRGRLESMLVLLGVLALAGRAEAQEYERGPGGAFNVSFIGANAVGDLGTVVDEGFGLELGAGFPMAADGMLRLRADVGFVVYGLEHIDYCGGFGCRVESTLTTTNAMTYGGIGPELVFGSGDVQPYVHTSAGLSWFVTSSSVDDHDGYGPYLETTNYSDVVFGLRYGGGVRFRMGGGRVFLDLGVTQHDNQEASYLTRGDIVDNPDGTITMYPNRSDADFLSFKLGVSIDVW